MSVSWNYGECEAYKTAKQFDDDSRDWKNFSHLAESLIWALLITGFPPKSDWAITDENWGTIFERLFIVERVSGSYRKFTDANGDLCEMYFTPGEVRSMIGLRVNAGNKSKREFDGWVMKRLYERANAKLTRPELTDDWSKSP